MKFLIASFDGLRPDLIDPNLTPNLSRVQAIGVTLARHRTVFPSETRVAFPSLVTGASPDRHGMMGNGFIDRSISPHRYLDTSNGSLLEGMDHAGGDALMGVPSLGELLHSAGKNLVVLSTNTSGTTCLFNHRAGSLNQVRISGHFRAVCTPSDVLTRIEAVAGRLPDAPNPGEPDLAGQEWITTAYLDFVVPQLNPDVTILSFGEPDTTSHLHGTGSRTTRETIAFCDTQFGRVLDWWLSQGRASGVQLVLTSDHGHITAHTKVSVADALRAGGFTCGAAPASGQDVSIVPGQTGSLYLADRSARNASKIVQVLSEQPWIGPIFTSARNEVEGVAPGSFAKSLVFAEHHRSPDIYFAFRADDTRDAFGLIGGTHYDGPLGTGLGVHGGLHLNELRSVGILAGDAFVGGGFVSEIASGICDIAPTIIDLLGLPVPRAMSGRRLTEIMLRDDAHAADLPVEEPEVFETGHKDYSQRLERRKVGEVVYLDQATVCSTQSATTSQKKEYA